MYVQSWCFIDFISESGSRCRGQKGLVDGSYASEASGGGSPLRAERRPSHRWQTESVVFGGAVAALEFVGFLTEH